VADVLRQTVLLKTAFVMLTKEASSEITFHLAAEDTSVSASQKW